MNRKPLYHEVASHLVEEINTGRLASGKKLPPEAQLARELQVSRATLREALGILVNEGYIRKVHGLGSFINHKRSVISAGLESLESYTATIRRSGYRAQDEMINVELTRLVDAMASDLKSEAGKDCILVESLRRADGVPVIYCRDYLLPFIAEKLEVDFVKERRPRHESLLDFLEEELDVVVTQGHLQLGAQPATGKVASMLEIEAGAPVLWMAGPTYDPEMRPLYYSQNYFWTERYTFSFVRRKSRSRSTKNSHGQTPRNEHL